MEEKAKTELQNMTPLRTLIRVLDRPGSRTLLAFLATWYARRLTLRDDRIFYDGVWMHRVEEYGCSLDKPRFGFYRDSVLNWRAKLEARFSASEDFWFYRYEPQPGDVIVDVGAGAGEDTWSFARAVGNAGRVIAIEAHPDTFRDLKKLCRWNSLKNTTCLQYAIMDRPSAVNIEDRNEFFSNSILPAEGETGHARLEVAAVRLDDLLSERGIEEVDFIKMNIEGAERYALDGMRDILSRARHVCVACHDFRADRGDGELFRTREVVAQCLHDLEFDLLVRDDDRRPYVRDHIHGVRRR